MSAVERARLRRNSSDQALALVGRAGPALGAGIIGILNRGGLSCDQGVLPVIDGMGIGIGKTQVASASYAAIDGEGCAVVVAAGGALEFVDGAELRDRSSERINTRRPRAVSDRVNCHVAKVSTV